MSKEQTLPPNRYMSRASLAAALDISESTVDEMVRRGVLPRPVRLSPGCIRWSWAAVNQSLDSLSGSGNNAESDPLLEAARNVPLTPRRSRELS